MALVAALAILVALSGAHLRCLAWLAVVVAPAVAVLLVGLNSHGLTATGVPLPTRESAGAELLVLLAAALALMLAGAHRLIAFERRRELSGARAVRIARGLLAGVTVLVVAGILAVAVSHRGLTGTVSHAWSSFTATRTTSVTDPSRLLSADSENRWVWWKEAARAFADRPIQGWGAGSFAVVHLLYRRDTLAVQQPHSLPLQFLSETGLVGAALGLGSLALLLAAGVAAVRGRHPRSPGAVALLAVGTAFCVHALYDWDWDIPALTLPRSSRSGSWGRARSRMPWVPMIEAGRCAKARRCADVSRARARPPSPRARSASPRSRFPSPSPASPRPTPRRRSWRPRPARRPCLTGPWPMRGGPPAWIPCQTPGCGPPRRSP